MKQAQAFMMPARGQRGVTLVVVLMVLVIVTLVGVGGARIALQGERSTRYDRDYLVASQAAEAALMDAEFDIRGPNTSGSSRVAQFSQDNMVIFETGCGSSATTRGLCLPAPGTSKPAWLTVDYLDNSGTAKSVEFGTFTGRVFDAGSAGVKPERPPRYIIEVIPNAQAGGDASKPSKMYRITAIGFGPRKEVQVVMQIGFIKEKG